MFPERNNTKKSSQAKELHGQADAIAATIARKIIPHSQAPEQH